MTNILGDPQISSGGTQILEIPRMLGFTSKKSMWTFDINVVTHNKSYVQLYLTYGSLPYTDWVVNSTFCNSVSSLFTNVPLNRLSASK